MKTVLINLLMAISASPTYSYAWHIQSHSPSKLRNPSAYSPRTSLALSAAAIEDEHSGISPAKAIKQALEATKKYGATSYKARLSWEIVEKIEYSLSRDTPQDTEDEDDSDDTKSTKQMIIADESPSPYDLVENNVRDLKSLLDEELAKLNDMRKMADEIKELKKFQSSHKSKSVEAIAAAQEATREYGIHSTQTALAWEAFEESVSGDLAP